MPKEFRLQLEELAQAAPELPSGTSVYQYISWLNDTLSRPDPLFTSRYQLIVEEEAGSVGERPFLTVITRTQGKRPEMLTETLLSLCAQTDSDFELLLIAHKVDEEKLSELRTLICSFPESFQARLRLLTLSEGNRATPLNYGFAHARGRYAAVLDDDDVVFDNWVENFHLVENKSPGSILYAYVVTQRWQTLTYKGKLLQQAVAAPGSECCRDFSLPRQFALNLCPLLGLAFPTLYFQHYGLIFDETLNTTEDWDYLMRLASLAGVYSIDSPSSMYRLWQNAENSHTVHSSAEWEENLNKIRGKFMEMPIVFPAGCEKMIVSVPGHEQTITPEREAIKKKCRRIIPTPLWNLAKKIYRALGGKKWLG